MTDTTLKKPHFELKVLAVVIIAGVLGYFVSVTAAFFWSVFLVFALFELDSKYIGQAALICLITLPLLLALGKQPVAEQMAVYAFFLLAITVALQIIELKRSQEVAHVKPIDVDHPEKIEVHPALDVKAVPARSIRNIHRTSFPSYKKTTAMPPMVRSKVVVHPAETISLPKKVVTSPRGVDISGMKRRVQ